MARKSNRKAEIIFLYVLVQWTSLKDLKWKNLDNLVLQVKKQKSAYLRFCIFFQ